MKLGVIGCGKMAYALVKGMFNRNAVMFSQVLASDVDALRQELFAAEFGAQNMEAAELAKDADVVLLAVKPAQIEAVVRGIGSQLDEKKLIVSVAAGIKTARIEAVLQKKIPVVRVMPNTPALVGEGMSALCPGAYAGSEHTGLVKSMCDCIGLAVVVEERYMDAVTAVSGSGPAYAFLFAEAQIEAAVNIGLSADMARQMVVQTIKGSVKMMEEQQQLHPAVLKAQVCSPAGTTIAAVRQLEAGGTRSAIFNAIEKAYQRAIELGME